MERDTQTITAGSHTFLVKTYATGRETQAIQSAYFKGTKVSVAGGAPTFSDFDPAMQFEVEQELVRQMVLKMNGDTENIVDRALDLPNHEYRDLISQLDALVSKKKN